MKKRIGFFCNFETYFKKAQVFKINLKHLSCNHKTMNISYNWLKEYLKFDLTPQQTSDVLTHIGL
ncbi:MAG: hypothetical protein PHS04_10135, partial [Tissierellia bacterium]|nr:hypothetical protein [Tissierellia bacterium]